MSRNIVIQRVDWDSHQDSLRAIRKAVFVEEQQVPEALEWDGRDSGCVQFLARIGSRPIATARLTAEGQIGRMAVIESERGKGIGARLLTAVIAEAKRQGYQQVFLHAQVNVEGFYQKFGFVSEGDVFLEAGIEHRTMRLSLGDADRDE